MRKYKHEAQASELSVQRGGSGRRPLPQSNLRTGALASHTVKVLFLHGWTSVPGGRKPSYLIEQGCTVINPKLPDEDFEESVRIAEAEFAKHQPDVVVGSSRGGAVAINMNSGDTPLVLLCPAWKNWGDATTVKPNTVILHSRADDVIPFADSEEIASNSKLPNEALIEIGNDGFEPPLDEIDGAARVCDPIFLGENEGDHPFGKFFKDYRSIAW